MISVSSTAKAREQWDLLRFGMLFIVLFFIYIEPNPTSTTFVAQGAAGQVEGQLLQQILWPCIALLTCVSIANRSHEILKQYDIFLIATLGWFALTTIYAIEPSVSMRRFLFMFFVMQAILTPMATVEKHKLIPACMLAIFAVATLYAYAYILVMPSHAIHSATGAEPQLVGLWRGQYAHKSISGLVFAMMAMLAIRWRAPPLYLIIFVPLQLLFVIKSGDKTVLFLTIPVFLLASVVARSRNIFAILLFVVAPLVLINLITVGSIYIDTFKVLASKIIGDASFTGRTELWRVLIYYTSLHPITGAGFQSFWQLNTSSPAVFYGGTWLKDAFYGHQSYLDLLATTGVPGLVLGLLFVCIRPALDLSKLRDRSNPLVAAYVTMWLFPLYQGVTESILFEKTSGSWIFLLLGILGLRKLLVEQNEAEAKVPRPIPRRRISGCSAMPARTTAEPGI